MGYQALIRELSWQLPGLKPVSLDAFEIKVVPEPGQDMAKLLGQEESMIETANVVLTPLPPLKAMSFAIDDRYWIKKNKRQYQPEFTENPERKLKVVFFHDSYGQKWMPFLGYNFNRVYFIWQYNWDMDFVEQQKPDVVIDEMLERFVVSKDPTNLTENNE